MRDEGLLYEFCVRNTSNTVAHDWFEGMQITCNEAGETWISGRVVDQAALHGLLNHLLDLDFQLISVRQVASGTDV